MKSTACATSWPLPSSLSNERGRIDSCGLPVDELRTQAAEYVAELAELGRPRLIFGHGRKLNASFNALVEGAYAPKLNIGAALAWYDADGFLKRLIEEIEAQPAKSEVVLSAKDRDAKLAALDAELLVLEFEEEACIVANEEEGPVLSRRLEADARAVLGVLVNRSTPAAAKLERVRS